MNGRSGMGRQGALAVVLALLGLLLGGYCFAASGDAVRGARLFSGAAAMNNGGAPCLACHGFAATRFGAAGGASFGPDLSRLHENFGTEGVAQVLASLPFPTMQPIYATRPLTEQEIADLGAFFATSKTGSLPGGGTLAAIVIAASVMFLGLVGLLGRRRLHGVRQPLVAQSRNKGGSPL